MIQRKHIVVFFALSALGFFLGAGWAKNFIHPTTEAEQIHVTNVYMMCDVIAKLLLSIAFTLSVRGITQSIAVVITSLMANDLADELFFDPCSNGWNEDILIFGLLTYLIYSFSVWHHRNSITSGTHS